MYYLKIDMDYFEEKTENLANMGGVPHSLGDKVNSHFLRVRYTQH